MKKFVFIALVASLCAYDVTTNDGGTGAGTLGLGFQSSQTPISLAQIPEQTITATNAYTVNTPTVLNTYANTIKRASGNLTLFALGSNALTINNLHSAKKPTVLQHNITGTGNLSFNGNIAYGVYQNLNSSTISTTGTITINDGLFFHQGIITNASKINILNNALFYNGLLSSHEGKIDNTTINIGITDTEDNGSTFINSQKGIITNSTINVYKYGTFVGEGVVNHIDNSGTIEVAGVTDDDTINVGQGGNIEIITLPTAANNGVIGSGLGTLVATGNVTHRSGSIFRLTVDAAGGSSLHDVSGVFTVESNATLQVAAEAGDYTQNFTYRVVEADGGIVGMFDSVAEINPNNIVTGAYHLEHYPTAIDLYFFATKATPTFLIANLSEQANNLQSTMLSYENDQRVMNWDLPCNTPPAKYQGYIVGNYANGHTSETSTMIPASYHIGGFQLGGTMMICDNFLGAGYFGYSHGYSKAYNKSVNTTANNYTLGFLFELFYKWCTLDFSAMYTRTQLETDRVNSNKGTPGGNLANGEIRALFNTQWKNFYFRPLLGVRYLGNWINSYTENAGTPDRLHYSSDNWNELLALGGFLASYRITTCKTVLTPHVKAEWIERLLRDTHSVTFQQAQGLYTTGTAQIQNQDHGYLSVTGGLSGTLCSCITIDGTYGMNFFQKDAPTRNYRMDVRYQF